MRLIFTFLFLMILSNSTHAQVGRWLKERQKQNLDRIKRYEAADSLNQSVMLRQTNQAVTLRRGASWMVGGAVVSGAALIAGNALLNADKPNKDGYTIMLVGSAAGLVMELIGASTIITAGKQFEVRFSSNN
jgi:uncharacterized protein YacL (UPF0231 family)